MSAAAFDAVNKNPSTSFSISSPTEMAHTGPARLKIELRGGELKSPHPTPPPLPKKKKKKNLRGKGFEPLVEEY
jgi:hypothetical protein